VTWGHVTIREFVTWGHVTSYFNKRIAHFKKHQEKHTFALFMKRFSKKNALRDKKTKLCVQVFFFFVIFAANIQSISSY